MLAVRMLDFPDAKSRFDRLQGRARHITPSAQSFAPSVWSAPPSGAFARSQTPTIKKKPARNGPGDPTDDDKSYLTAAEDLPMCSLPLLPAIHATSLRSEKILERRVYPTATHSNVPTRKDKRNKDSEELRPVYWHASSARLATSFRITFSSARDAKNSKIIPRHIVGLWHFRPSECRPNAYYGMYALQHRGQKRGDCHLP